MDMADRINAFLAEKNLKQVDFARIADIDKGTLSLMLNRTTAPEKAQAGNVMKAARAMGISMEELLTGERPSADAQIQLTNHVKALQIAMRSVVRALDSNIRVVGQAVGSELRAEAAGNPEEGIKPFDARSGLLLEVLSILGQAHLVGEVAALRASDLVLPYKPRNIFAITLIKHGNSLLKFHSNIVKSQRLR